MPIAFGEKKVPQRFAMETGQPNTKTSQVEVFERRNQSESTPNFIFFFTAKVLSKTQNMFFVLRDSLEFFGA